jgi:hypothetical protein
MTKPALLALVFALVAFGCDGVASNPDDLADDQLDDGKADAEVVRPIGTFRAVPPAAGGLAVLVLKADRTFHYEQIVYCVRAPCPPLATEGSYSYSKSGSTRYLRFKDAQGNLVNRYAYTVAARTLKLRLVNAHDWQLLEPSAAAGCATAADSEGPGLIQPMCGGGFSCVTNECAYRCGPPEPVNACEQAGGACVALYPGACADGEVGDANRYGCGGGLGVMCCLPRPQGSPMSPDWCADGTIASGEPTFIDSADGKQCDMPSVHCVTRDNGACPQLAPLPPGWCADGTIIRGASTFIDSADGKQCELPSVHCVTRDGSACPQLAPLPPDWCADGTIVQGAPTFFAPADGKQCEMPNVHCVTRDASACPQL